MMNDEQMMRFERGDLVTLPSGRRGIVAGVNRIEGVVEIKYTDCGLREPEAVALRPEISGLKKRVVRER